MEWGPNKILIGVQVRTLPSRLVLGTRARILRSLRDRFRFR